MCLPVEKLKLKILSMNVRAHAIMWIYARARVAAAAIGTIPRGRFTGCFNSHHFKKKKHHPVISVNRKNGHSAQFSTTISYTRFTWTLVDLYPRCP